VANLGGFQSYGMPGGIRWQNYGGYEDVQLGIVSKRCR